MTTIKASTQREHYSTLINSTSNTIVADETLSNGGQEKGFTPHELLAASLASCTTITLRMYVDRKQWQIEEIKAMVNIGNDAKQNITSIDCEIEVQGNVTEEQKTRLLQIANQCPVHKILSNPIIVTTKLK